MKCRSAVVQCFGLPGSGKSQLILQQAENFEAMHDTNSVNYYINIKERSVTSGLKDLVGDMKNNKFLLEEVAQSIIFDLQQNTAGRLADALLESTASVLIIIDNLGGNDKLLRDLIRRVETKAHTSSCMFLICITSRQRYPLHSETEIQKMNQNEYFSYVTKQVHGFNEEEAYKYLCQDQHVRESNRTDAKKVFERFSGLPLLLETTIKYCLQREITYKKYLEGLTTLSLETLMQNEMEAQTREYQEQHPFYSIINPIIGRDIQNGVTAEWDYLACMWHLDFFTMPEIVWKSFYGRFCPETSSLAEADNRADRLMKRLFDHSSCERLTNGTVRFKSVVALSFFITRQIYAKSRNESFKCLKTTIEVMFEVLKEQKSKTPSNLQIFLEHLKKLEKQVQKKGSDISSKKQKELAGWIKICSK